MKPKMKKMLDTLQKYNVKNMCELNYGLKSDVVYDCLVVAPGWKPTKLLEGSDFKVTTLAVHSYISGFLVEKDNLKIAWIQVASSAANLLDHLALTAELKYKKLIFIGAVGALTTKYNVGDVCTPSYSVSGVFANAYLEDDIHSYKPFQKVYPNKGYIKQVINMAKSKDITINEASVYCTDSIAMEYYHLDAIKEFGTDLIEMETSTFYLLADLLDVPSIALLVVSDNSASGDPLVGRDETLNDKYNHGRKVLIPQLIELITKDEFRGDV